MGAALFIGIGILFMLSIPIVTSRMANRMGRNPKVWFVIAMFLPLLSAFILFCLKDLSEKE